MDGRLSERLGLSMTVSVLLATTHVPSRKHVLHQCPQVHRVGIVPYYRSTRLFAPYPGDILLMVSVKYEGWTTDDPVFNKLMQTAVRLVEDDEVGIGRKIVEEIEQCQSGNAYTIFEHIDVMLLVEGELFVDILEERCDIAVVIPYENVTHRPHVIIAPRNLT